MGMSYRCLSNIFSIRWGNRKEREWVMAVEGLGFDVELMKALEEYLDSLSDDEYLALRMEVMGY